MGLAFLSPGTYDIGNFSPRKWEVKMWELAVAILVGLVVSFFASWLARLTEERRMVWPFTTDQTLGGLFNLALFVAMLFGIFANYFWVHGVGWPTDPNAFWRPVLISPIVFLAVYVAATKQPKGLLPVLLAFQNGFFWQTVLEGARPR
jgi:hypothetical protein